MGLSLSIADPTTGRRAEQFWHNWSYSRVATFMARLAATPCPAHRWPGLRLLLDVPEMRHTFTPDETLDIAAALGSVWNECRRWDEAPFSSADIEFYENLEFLTAGFMLAVHQDRAVVLS